MRSLYGPLVKLIIFLVITAVTTYVLAATIANSSFGDTKTYKADFTDVTGLNLNDDVRIAGVRVGTVTDMKLERDDAKTGTLNGGKSYTQVTFTVQKSRSLPTTAEATLRYRNLVGQRYIDVEFGPTDNQSFTDGKFAVLKAGSTIPISQTNPAVDLTILFQGFGKLVDGLAPEQINKLSYAVIQTLQGEGGALTNLLMTVADLTNALADKDQVIGDVIDNLSSVLQTLGERNGELTDLIIQLRTFISGLAGDRTTIGNAIDGINNLATSTAGLLTQVRPPLKSDIVQITGLLNLLNRNSGVVDYVLQQLPPTVAGLIRTASYGSWFNFYLCNVKVTLNVGKGIAPVTPELPVNALGDNAQSTNAIRGCSN